MCPKCPHPDTERVPDAQVLPSAQPGGYPAPRSVFGPQENSRVEGPFNGDRVAGPLDIARTVSLQNNPHHVHPQHIPRVASLVGAPCMMGLQAQPHTTGRKVIPRPRGPANVPRPVRPQTHLYQDGPWNDHNGYNPDGIADLAMVEDFLRSTGDMATQVYPDASHEHSAAPQMPGGPPPAAPLPPNKPMVQQSGGQSPSIRGTNPNINHPFWADPLVQYGGFKPAPVNLPPEIIGNPRVPTAPYKANFISTANKPKSKDVPADVFFRLPIELRMNIYEGLLLKPWTEQVNLNSNEDSAPPALTQVCRTMRQEALPVWMKNEFYIIVRNYDTSRGEAWHAMMAANFVAYPKLRSVELTFSWPDCHNERVGPGNLMRLLKQGWQGSSNFLSWKSKEEADAHELEKKRKAKRRGEYDGPIGDEPKSDSDNEEDVDEGEEPVMRQYIRFCKLIDMMHELRKNKALRWKDVEGTFKIAVEALALAGEDVCTDCYERNR